MRASPRIGRMLRAVWLGLALAAPGIATGPAFAQQAQSVVAEQDGIAASLAVGATAAEIGWRFVRPTTAPVADITVSIDGKPIGSPTLQPYPGPDQQSAILLLLDVTDARRDRQILLDKRSMAEIAARARPHHRVASAAFSDGSQGVSAATGDATAIALAIANATPRRALTNLGRVLASAIEDMSRESAARRAIYVMTDGYSDDGLDVGRLGAAAKAADVAIVFVLSPSGRPTNLRGVIEQLASATGGFVVDEARLPAFLRAPYTLIDSGASATFPFGDARRYWWSFGQEVRAVFRYGDRQLALVAPVTLRRASLAEHGKELWRNHRAATLALLIGLPALVGGGLAWRARRNARPPGPTFEARLEDIESHSVFRLEGDVLRIGRDPTNDVVIPDHTVSRHHAVLRLQPKTPHTPATYAIENAASLNGMLVNDAKVDRAVLAEGDVIRIGDRRLRFTTRVSVPLASTEVHPR